VYQGPTTAYIIPLLALKELPEWSCPVTNIDVSNTTMTGKYRYNYYTS